MGPLFDIHRDLLANRFRRKFRRAPRFTGFTSSGGSSSFDFSFCPLGSAVNLDDHVEKSAMRLKFVASIQKFLDHLEEAANRKFQNEIFNGTKSMRKEIHQVKLLKLLKPAFDSTVASHLIHSI